MKKLNLRKNIISFLQVTLTNKINTLVPMKIVPWITLERIRIYPPLIPILMLVTWVASVLLGPGLTDISGTIIGSDFLAFYTAGNFWLSDTMDYLYDFQAQLLFQKSVIEPVESNALYPFINPPFIAVFYALFAKFSYFTALIIWWSWGLLLVVISIILLKTEFPNFDRYSVPKFFIYCFMFYPTLAWLTYGQNTTHTLCLYTVVFIMLRRKKDLIAGVALGLLLYKPQLAITICLVLLLKWRWRALLGGMLGAALWLFVGFASSSTAMLKYIKVAPHLFDLLRSGGNIEFPTWGIHSFFGFSSLLLDNFWMDGANILAVCLSICCIIFISLIWFGTEWNVGTKSWDLLMAATFGMGLIISPHLYIYDLMLLLLPFAIVWNYHIAGKNGRALDGNLLLFWSAVLYIICFIGSYISVIQLKAFELVGLSPFALQLSTLIIFCWCASVIRDGASPNLKS
jgi:hypothetical protein